VILSPGMPAAVAPSSKLALLGRAVASASTLNDGVATLLALVGKACVSGGMEMKRSSVGGAVFFTVLVAGCGGGDGSAMPMAYAFVTPAANSQRSYSRVLVDNSNNTINEAFVDTVTAVNPDGSYMVMQEDPNHNSVTVNGTLYSIPTETLNSNDSGQVTSYTYAAPDGALITCTYNPHAAGPDFPVTIGQTWTLAYTRVCGSNAPISYIQSGTVVDVESMSVAAGTYSALKLQSTITWTDPNGTTFMQTITNWRDVNTMLSVKESVAIAASGTAPVNGYAVTSDTQLQSGS
jgi:hypothetical protein